MGLTSQSTGLGALKEMFEVRVESADTLVVALAGNPNTGKSTVFNSLTGLRQHTGNWPGKTVTNAQGAFEHQNRKFILVDLPGTYSLMATSVEEEVARDFICFGKPHATVVVTDATCLERNLNLVLQVIEVTPLVVVCVNLIDEATRKGIEVDLEQLSKELGVPVVGTNARDGIGLDQLKDAVLDVAKGQSSNTPPQIEYASWVQEAIAAIANTLSQDLTANIPARWLSLRLLESDESLLISIKRYSGSEKMELLEEVHHGRTPEEIRDSIATSLVSRAESISNTVVCFTRKGYNSVDRRIDNIVTSKLFGFPIMLALLGLIFWLTIEGANVPSAMLATGLHWVEERLSDFLLGIPIPTWIHGVLVTGVYRTLAWVIAVMLPPMAIFFPLFTLLEDLGYL
ncbi:MAG: FeoB small GTPase domain-containing protein, partial [Bacillota bacterium]|nr:FeoB small GTPase domain-containing protein [Bacillota bacterium]